MREGAGIKLNIFNRAMFAIKEQSLKLLVSTNLNSNSKDRDQPEHHAESAEDHAVSAVRQAILIS